MRLDLSDDARDDTGGTALDALERVRAVLQGPRIVLGPLFDDMSIALHSAVECWLRRREEPISADWVEREARLLRLAPPALRDDYLRVAGAVPRIAEELLDLVEPAELREFAIDTPALASWRVSALDWMDSATLIVGALLDADLSRQGHRIERGELRGRLDSLVPCLLLARFGGRSGRWRDGDGRAGLFEIRESASDGGSGRIHEGVLLPLELCRDRDLRQKLLAFTALLQEPIAGERRDVAGRRRALQAWLDREGLGALRLVDREPIERWACLTLSDEVFSDILRHLDYVTAVEDSKGRLTRILEHAPFAWSSRGALIDWSVDEDRDTPIHPFRLYLATDVGSLSEPSWKNDGRWSFRPASYWSAFALPDEAARAAGVSVRLTQRGYGWIDLDIRFGERTERVLLSDVFDPLPALLDWLQAVSDGDLPIGVEVDEEGTVAGLVAHAFGEDRLLVAVLDRLDETERAAAMVERDGFVAALREEFRRFLNSEFRVGDWIDWIDGPEEADRYRRRLLAHPFIA